MENRSETIEELNDILERTYDSIEGYRKAAENATENKLMGYFNDQVITRKGYIDELTAEVKRLGGTPKDSGTVEGTLHRAWIDFKTALSFEKDEDIVEACIVGEKKCIEEYNDLMEEGHIPLVTRELLTRQKLGVQKALVELEVKEEMLDD